MSRIACWLWMVPACALGQALDADLETRVTALLRRMTLEEKAGQMTQVAIDVVSAPPVAGARHRLDPAKLQAAILTYRVGSILNVMGQAYTVDNWHEILNQIQDTVEKSRLKIPVIYGIDSVHGANYTLDAVLFPQAVAMAATWDPALAARAGTISAWQTRASGIRWNFYPVLDIGRQPLWPRLWETFGEDPFLTTEMGRAYIGGLQGTGIASAGRVAACLKHYAGYSLPFNGKDRTPAILDERTLRQVVLAPFEAGVKAGAPTVMVNSGEISGVPGHANKWLLTDVLKREWGFQGFTVSDWEDIKRLHTRDRVAETPKDAVRLAVNAGVDMSMVPNDFSFYELLLQCARDGSVPLARIDDAVRRILRVKLQLGLFENPRPDASLKAAFDKPEFHQANLEIAREALTLLKNEGGVLPLGKTQRILVTGPAADLLSVLNGGWTITWQGDQEALYPKNKPTILKAIREKAAAVEYVPGTTFDKTINLAAALAAASRADVIVAVIGEKAYCETPGNLEDFTLEEPQRQLVAALAGTGKPVVVVYAGGRPRVLGNIAADAKAFLMAYLPGEQGGRAVADVLFGEVNPSGRLPFSWPRRPNGFTTYDYKALEATSDNFVGWEFPFAAGLSYTTFETSGLRVDPKTLAFTATVRNTGRAAGKTVIPLFLSDLYRSVTPPNKELKAFAKVELQPGESRTVRFGLTRRDLMFVGLDNRWVFEAGRFRATLGAEAVEFDLR